MTTLRFQLFGKISIQQDEQILVDLPIKALELLCYLLLYRERIHTRENLAELLWPDTPNSKKYFRQAFWQLQAVLERYLPARTTDGEALFLLNPGWIRVNPQAAWWLDVAGLEQAYELCSAIPGTAFAAGPSPYVRFSYAASLDILHQAADRIRAFADRQDNNRQDR